MGLLKTVPGGPAGCVVFLVHAKVVVEGTRQSHQLDVDSIRQLLNPFSSSLFGNTDPAILM